MRAPAPEQVKACCAAAYASPAARFLLGGSFHPGGAALTRRLIGALRPTPQSRVVDVACGVGTSTLQLVRERGCSAVGVDLAPENVAAAEAAAAAAGLAGRARFVVGDAEALPLGDASADGALCECAFCTFPAKETAVRELARVVRPGGRLALSDVTADRDRLPAELRDLHAWVACVADARPLDELAELLEGGGFEVEERERADGALLLLLDRIEARLRVAAMLDRPPDGLGRGRELLAAARAAVAGGALGYGVLVARRS